MYLIDGNIMHPIQNKHPIKVLKKDFPGNAIRSTEGIMYLKYTSH
jgi:hypothetical protein